MKYILAISGGVDSVALLDMAARGRLHQDVLPKDCTVAHFNHGIRAEASRDAEFVRSLAKEYGLPFVLGRGKLGTGASEQLARRKRYEFLRSIYASGQSATIVTAHHQDDLIETILINLIRGTGWRGLSPFWSPDIMRPLIGRSKAELVAYAIKNDLKWAEDKTNYSPKYLRNRVRDLTVRMRPATRKNLLQLYEKQHQLRAKIEGLLNATSRVRPGRSREMTALPEGVALEVLGKMVDGRLTMPQLKRLLVYLQTAKSGDICQPGGGLQVGLYRGGITISDLPKHPARHKEVE